MSKMPEYCALSNIKSKIKAEEEKKLRGLSFAKLFFTEKNYEKALTYVNEYLSVKENSSFAYKLLGDIHEALDDNEKAFEAFKKSYMLDKSQDNLLFKICEKLTLINADNKTIKNWLQLLEKKFPKHQAVFYLKEKLANSENNELMASPFLDIAPVDTSIANLTNLTNLTNFTSVTNYTNKDDLKTIERNQDRLFKKLVDFETDIHKKIDSIKDDILKENQSIFDNFKTEIDKVSSSLIKLQIGQQELKQVLEDFDKNNYDKDYDLDDEDDDYEEEDEEEEEKVDLSFNNKNVNMLENSKGIFSRLGPVSSLNNQNNVSSNTSSFPDKFLPAKDSWECSACYLRNQSNDIICKSCETPKLGTIQQPKQPVAEKKNEKSAFGSFFKDPTKMPWDCKSCNSKNNQDLVKCSTCSAAKPSSGFLASNNFSNNNVASNTNNSFNNNSNFSFNFAQSKPNENSKFVFGNTSVGNTSFTSTVSNTSFNINKPVTSNTSFNLEKSPAPKTPLSASNPSTNTTPFNLNNSPSNIPSFNINQAQTNVPFNLGNLSINSSPFGVNSQTTTIPPFGVSNQTTSNQPLNVNNQTTHNQPFGINNQNKVNTVFQIGANQQPKNDSLNMNPIFMPNVNLSSFNLPPNPIFDKTNQASFVFGKNNVSTGLGSANTNEIFKPNTESSSKISFNFTLKDSVNEKAVANTEVSNKADLNDNAENYEPQVEFEPVIPLPPKIDVVTGEENEKILFVNRAKLYRFTDNEWKERGKGEFKILFDEKNKKYRFLMRRDQVLKVCLNSPITSQFKFTQKNKNEENKKTETNILHWCGLDFSEESSKNELFAIKFKNKEIAESLKEKVLEIVDILSGNIKQVNKDLEIIYEKKPKSIDDQKMAENLKLPINFFNYLEDNQNKCTGCHGCKDYIPKLFYENQQSLDESKNKLSSFDNNKSTSLGDNLFSTAIAETNITSNWGLFKDQKQGNTKEQPKWMESALAPIFSDEKNLNDPEAEANLTFKPVIPLPDLISLVTGEEDEDIIFSQRSKLFKFINDEWKERGVGEFKFLKDKKTEKLRFLMRRDIVHKVCLNHFVDKSTFKIKFRHGSTNVLQWSAKDFSEGIEEPSVFNLKFKNNDIANQFLEILKLEGIELTV